MKTRSASSTRSAQHEPHFPDGVDCHAPHTARGRRGWQGDCQLVLSRPEAHGLTIQWTAPALQLAQHLVFLATRAKRFYGSSTGTTMRAGCGALSTPEFPCRSQLREGANQKGAAWQTCGSFRLRPEEMDPIHSTTA